MRRFVLALAVVGIVAGNALLPDRHSALYGTPLANRTRADVLLDVLGEGRTVLARILWFKMDLFHEILDRQGVPHHKQAELLPLLRMITFLDPRLDDAYDILVMDLYRGYGRTAEALAICDEGITYNPTSFWLRFHKAWILFKEERWPEAAVAIRACVRHARDDVDRLNIVRLAYHIFKSGNDLRNAEQSLRLWFQIRPGDPSATRFWRESHNGEDPPAQVSHPGK